MVRKGEVPLTAQEVKDAITETGSVRGAAKKLGCTRRAIQYRLNRIEADDGGRLPRRESLPSRWRPVDEIIAARKAEFERVFAARPDVGSVVHLADDLPFMLVALGDPHLDNPGTDLDAWERWTGFLDHRKHIHGFGLGDWLDNWVRVLSFLYAKAETPAPEGWIMLEHYLEQTAPHLIGSVGGNHDAWAGQSDMLAHLMAKHGVPHRGNSIRQVLRAPGGHEVTLHARHGWPGKSMYNEVHGIKRAAQRGQRFDILLGGHTHISGHTMDKDPMTGAISHGYQVASFKMVDDYQDDLGLEDKNAAPAVALVIDPRRPPTDPGRVVHFYDPEQAQVYLRAMRRAKAA